MVAMGLNKGLAFKPFVLAHFGSLGPSSRVKSFSYWARFVLVKPKALLRGLSRCPMLVGFSKSSFPTLATRRMLITLR